MFRPLKSCDPGALSPNFYSSVFSQLEGRLPENMVGVWRVQSLVSCTPQELRTVEIIGQHVNSVKPNTEGDNLQFLHLVGKDRKIIGIACPFIALSSGGRKSENAYLLFSHGIPKFGEKRGSFAHLPASCLDANARTWFGCTKEVLRRVRIKSYGAIKLLGRANPVASLDADALAALDSELNDLYNAFDSTSCSDLVALDQQLVAVAPLCFVPPVLLPCIRIADVRRLRSQAQVPVAG